MTKPRSLEQEVPVVILPTPNLSFLGNYLFVCSWKHLSKAHTLKDKQTTLAEAELANPFHQKLTCFPQSSIP